MEINLKDIENLVSSREVDICDDSRKVKPGDVFVAVKGGAYDGHAYIGEAISRGARFVVCEKSDLLRDDILRENLVIVPDSRKALGLLAKKRFDDPSHKLVVYGVTGTNGKSTTISIIESVFNSMSIPCGMTGTVFNKIEGDILERSDMTTCGVLKLNYMLRSMLDNGKKAAAVEISSHALDQERVYGIELDGAVLTNITPEHMDYHGDMASYVKAKSKIFMNLKPAGVAALNSDDERIRELAYRPMKGDIITFGFSSQSGVHCSNVLQSPDGSEFDLIFYGENIGRVHSSLTGKHNISNLLGAAAVFLKKGFPGKKVIAGLDFARPVPGRLEKVPSSAPFNVFVDYAHTPDALRSALESVRAATKGKLFCVFGCGGNRDTGKRPVMGGIAGKLCDGIVLTDDNPRKEDPDKILSEIKRGIPEGVDCSIIRERKEAILNAVSKAGKDDTVLIAGKGHENYQIFADKTIHFDDREEVLSILDKMGYNSEKQS